jgi:DNA-binding transcriptional LysR family regulator
LLQFLRPQVQRLERELGVRLLEPRTRRRELRQAMSKRFGWLAPASQWAGSSSVRVMRFAVSGSFRDRMAGVK